MAVTWRAVALAAAGLLPVLLLPVPGTVVVWALVVVAACAVDALLAASPRRLALTRRVPTSVRLAPSSTSWSMTASAMARTAASGLGPYGELAVSPM